jgi:Fe-S cluster biosynthesis and repair protein YggX
MVLCAKLGRELPGLDAPPWPGALGQRIYDQISQEAWDEWEERMKMILNEYRLLPFQKEAQAIIAKQMEEFLFGDAASVPPGYVPDKS